MDGPSSPIAPPNPRVAARRASAPAVRVVAGRIASDRETRGDTRRWLLSSRSGRRNARESRTGRAHRAASMRAAMATGRGAGCTCPRQAARTTRPRVPSPRPPPRRRARPLAIDARATAAPLAAPPRGAGVDASTPRTRSRGSEHNTPVSHDNVLPRAQTGRGCHAISPLQRSLDGSRPGNRCALA